MGMISEVITIIVLFSIWINGLDNGLTREEHRLLFEIKEDIDEIKRKI